MNLKILKDSPNGHEIFKKDQIVKASRYNGQQYLVGIYYIEEKDVEEIYEKD